MRFGMILCSNERLADGGMQIRPEALKRLTARWSLAIGRDGPLGKFGFGWKDQSSPLLFRSRISSESKEGPYEDRALPATRGTLFKSLDGLNPTPDDELFFYYYGHAYIFDRDDIILSLEGARLRDKRHTFRHLVEEFVNAGFRKIYFVLDTCHAGRQVNVLSNYENHVYGIFASSDGAPAVSGSDMGLLSEAVLSQLDVSRLHNTDKRIDRRKRGMTVARCFMEAIRNVSGADEMLTPPVTVGKIGDENVIYPYEPTVPDELNALSPARSIYRKLHAILVQCAAVPGGQTFSQAYGALKKQRLFWTREAGPNGKPEIVSPTRVGELVDFLTQLGLVESTHERQVRHLKISPQGRNAARPDQYNKALLRAIEDHVLPEGFDLNAVRDITFELMNDAEIPNAYYVAEKLKSKGARITKEAAFKMSFLILPYTLRFRKVTTDTIFPELL